MELPLCSQCGAAPGSRQELECRFCGAILPWEIWDEISRERIQIVEAEATSLLGAMVAVERSPEFRKAVGPLRRLRRRRLRKMRDRLATNQSAQPNQSISPGAALFLGLVLVIVWAADTVTESRRALAFTAAAALTVLAMVIIFLRSRLPKKRRRKRRRIRGSIVPFGVLAVSPPQLLPHMTDELRRKVTLYFLSENQRVLIAKCDLELAPGQVGFGRIRGMYLETFRAMQTVPVHPQGEET